MASISYQQRINIITGQLNAISSMIASNTDTIEIITQLKAIKSALQSLIKLYTSEELEKYIRIHSNENTICSKLIKELISN